MVHKIDMQVSAFHIAKIWQNIHYSIIVTSPLHLNDTMPLLPILCQQDMLHAAAEEEMHAPLAAWAPLVEQQARSGGADALPGVCLRIRMQRFYSAAPSSRTKGFLPEGTNQASKR